MDFIAADAPESLAEATGLDTRYVAVVWRQPDEKDSDEVNDEARAGRPQLILGGMSEFEAVGLLRAATKVLERENEDLIDAPGIIDEEEDDDEA